MRYGLIGGSLGHSFSKEIHERLDRYEYELMEISPSELESFMRKKEFHGINVTIPYKEAVIPFLDDISPGAFRIGSVNTVINRGGRLYGDNTDFGGLEALIRRMGLDLSGETVLIAGSGGTSLTARELCLALGAEKAIRMGRSGADGSLSYEVALRKHSDAAFLINTTPAGMYPDTEGMALDVNALPCLKGVVDAVYNPLRSRLVLSAGEKGIKAEGGLYMLCAQALLSFGLFTGEKMPVERLDSIYAEILKDRENIVLTGMPGSGKSTVGELIAKRLGREHVDTDEEIVKRAGMPVKDIFKRYGEQYFRNLESKVISELSRTGGKLISTGGGAVLRKRNVFALKMNGCMVFLDRDLSELLPEESRPLADDSEKITWLFNDRYDIYRQTGDISVKVKGEADETADTVLKRWREHI